MELSRKNLKVSSIVVLIFAALTLIQVIFGVIFGEFNSAEIPEGAPDNILMITRIILLSVSALFLIPQVYVGLKGIFIAKNPTSSKGHIVWAWILLGIDVLSLISPIIGLVNNGDTGNSIGTILSLLLEITIYIEYIKYAIDVSKGK